MGPMQTLSMDNASEDKVVNVDRVDETFVLVEFADGKAGLYAGSLLRRMLPKAKIMSDHVDDGDQ